MSLLVQTPVDAPTASAASGPAPQAGAAAAIAGSGRIPSLDGIRGIAILLVLGFHFVGVGLNEHVSPGLLAVTKWGWIGVNLFFVLSGFLITGILLDARGSAGYFRNFYARRAVRIFPAYYLLLVGILALAPLSSSHASTVVRNNIYGPYWIYWSYTSNFYFAWQAHSTGWLGHSWSLAIEEQFYLVWPALIFLCSRRQAMRMCAGIVAGSAILRTLLLIRTGSIYPVYFLTFTHMDGLAIGAAAAILLRDPGGRDRLARISGWMIFAAPAALAGIYYLGKISHRQSFILCEEAVKFTLLDLGFVSVLGIAMAAKSSAMINRVLGSAPLSFFGRYSYGLYLYHLPLILLINSMVPEPQTPGGKLLMCGTYAVGTVGVSLLSWHLFETHCLKLKRLFPLEHAA